ncbi:DnaT-like ssDNA-binding domain-containing protein [Pantoea agglomerans]|uniref:DnaT-like ssDNA-binding domain-containing protein n=1 Tax=Enterobacter agglomerans TaxID=549 RepID=UPI003F73796C
MIELIPGKGVGQDLTGVGHELTGVGQEMPQGRSAHAPRGGSGAAPITSHSFEPVTEPKNNTHTASSNFESVDNFATAPPHECNDPKMQTGSGVKAGICSSTEPPAPERKTRSTQARHKNPVLPDAIERVSNLINLKTGDKQLRANRPAPFSKHVPNHTSAKFAMFEGWRPSSGLSGTARKIGIELSGPPDPARLADFVSYWEADGAAYNQIQWEMKLARSLKNRRQRAPKRHSPCREFTASSGMDYTIPEGFRG